MPLDLSFITSNEEFIDYFIYYYEFSFLVDDSNINVKKELENIIQNYKFTNYRDLWIYTYLKFSIILLKDYPLDFLKTTIEKMSKDFLFTNHTILEIQLQLMKESLKEIGVNCLEIRPYEQLKIGSPYGDYLNKKEESLIKLFEDNISSFSETNLNKVCYVKLKNKKYMNKSKLLFELYSVVLFECIEDSLEEDFQYAEVDVKIKEFLYSFKKGKFNKELFECLKRKTIKYMEEYKSQSKIC